MFEAYTGNAANFFDERGNLANDSIEEFVTKFMQAFARWVDIHTSRQGKVLKE